MELDGSMTPVQMLSDFSFINISLQINDHISKMVQLYLYITERTGSTVQRVLHMFSFWFYRIKANVFVWSDGTLGHEIYPILAALDFIYALWYCPPYRHRTSKYNATIISLIKDGAQCALCSSSHIRSGFGSSNHTWLEVLMTSRSYPLAVKRNPVKTELFLPDFSFLLSDSIPNQSQLILQRGAIFYPVVQGALSCSQKSFKLVWRCNQPLSGFLAKGHLPRPSRQSGRSLW